MATRERARVAAGPEHQTKAAAEADAILPTTPDTVAAPVLAGAPCRSRTLWLVVVPHCPHCEAVRICPVTSREYVLTPGGRHG